jgi:hypothetical protein
MKPQSAKNIVHKLIIANLTVVFILMLLGAGHAKSLKSQGPPFPFPGGKKGQEAITALQGRLPEVASKHGKSAQKLKKIFLQDEDLWLDPAENLLYLCSFNASEAETLPESADGPIPTGPFPLNETFQLHSLAGASKVIYLDFDGHVTSGTIWNSNFNGGADIVSLPYDFDSNTGSFSDAELSRIQKIWARVAEDFAMYNIDVTTEDPGVEAMRLSGSGDQNYGVRVIISPSSTWYGNAGGVAYIGSFDWNSDTPTFVFSNKLGNGSEKYVTDAASHETGHTLGLYHDGADGTAYYAGHGNWAPIMGVGYYEAITQWSKGEYAGANNTEDDLAVMLTNGASYRSDDHGDWINNATMLAGDLLEGSGIIERTEDIDIFSFQTDAGDITINIDPANLDPNLDILVQILDDGGNIMGEDDPYYILPASISLNLPAGTYYILIDGVGTGDPDTGYTDYASLGQYFISGQLPTAQFPPDAPLNLTVMASTSSRINMSWTDNSTNENGFSIERSPNGVDAWVAVGFTGGNISTYEDTGLTPNTTYHYRVSAYNVIGSSSFTNTASATTFDLPPNAPSGLTAAAQSSERIDLGWTDNANNESGFTVERSMNGVNNWTEIGFSEANNTNYSDTGLVSGTVYYYRVAAYNQNGSSGFSNTANDATDEIPPEAPTSLTASAIFADQVDLSWADNANNESGFTIERSPNGSDSWLVIDQIAANRTSYSDMGLESGTAYYYRIAAYNTAGNSDYSNIVEATTDVPPQFVDRTAIQEAAVAGTVSGTFVDTAANDSGLEIIVEQSSGGRPRNRYSYLEHKWIFQVQPGSVVSFFANAWTDASAQGDMFVFSYSTDNENYTDMFTVNADYDDDSYQVFGLPNDFSGSLYIRVTDGVRTPGQYDKSTIYIDHLFIRVDNEPGSLPADPTGLEATPVSPSAIDLSWTDNTDNEMGFSIERSLDGNGGWQQVGSVSADITAYTDNGLNPATAYFYRVQAYNGTGSSGYSNVANASTLQADTMHVEALESASTVNRSRWNAYATITVVDQDGNPVTGVAVSGSWSVGGSTTAVTDGNGQCTLSKTKIKTSVNSATFTVTTVSGSSYIYDQDSNFSDSIEVFQP